MSYTKDEKDWLGRDRKGHYDDKGNKIGTSKQEKDWLGKERTANFDSQGNKIGISKEEKDWLGNEKTVHYDADGNKSGSSRSEKDWKGDDIIQNYDEKGNKTVQSKYEKDWLGRSVLKHSKTSNSGNTAIGYLILFAIVVIVVLGTFSFPYKLIDSELQPFKLGWVENRNVWIFCASIWILVITLFSTLKSIFADKEGVRANEYSVSNNLITTLLLIASSAITAAFIIKAKFPEEFLPWGISAMAILLLIYGLLFFKTSRVLHTAITFAVFAFASIFYLNQEPSLSTFSESITVAPIINPESNNTVTQVEETGNYITDEETAKEQFRSFNTIMVNGNPEELNNLLSDQLEVYMSLKNQSKNSVIKDKISYQKKWQITNVSAQKFERLNDHQFEYTTIVTLFKKSDPDFKRDFLISGVLGFDRNNKIKSMLDKETISLYVENPIKTETFNDISGTSWSILHNETVPAGYFSFKSDGSVNYNLSDDQNYKWNIEDETLIINISDFSTLTCTLTEGDLLCNGENKEGANWSMKMVRKK
jgi:hypothetical protein